MKPGMPPVNVGLPEALTLSESWLMVERTEFFRVWKFVGLIKLWPQGELDMSPLSDRGDPFWLDTRLA